MRTRKWRGARIQIVEHEDDFGAAYLEPMYRLGDVPTARIRGLTECVKEGHYHMYFPREACSETLEDGTELITFVNFADPEQTDAPLQNGVYKQVLRDIADLLPYWPDIVAWVVRDLTDFIKEREAHIGEEYDPLSFRRPIYVAPEPPPLPLRVSRKKAQAQEERREPIRKCRPKKG